MKYVIVAAGCVLLMTCTVVAPAGAQEYSVPASPTSLVVFQPLRATLAVAGWDRDSVRIVAEGAGAVRVEVESSTDAVQVLERRTPSDAAVRPTYRLFIPRGATVRISVQEGTVALVGLEGTVRAGIVDGSMRADSIAGNAELSTVTGPLELRDSRGRLEARSVAGDLVLSRVSGAIRARTTSGAVRIDLVERSAVVAESYSGGIALSGSLGGGPSSLSTNYGDIRVRLPDSGDVMLLVTAIQTNPVVDCNSVRQAPADGKPLRLGVGGDVLELVTFAGAIDLRCAR